MNVFKKLRDDKGFSRDVHHERLSHKQVEAEPSSTANLNSNSQHVISLHGIRTRGKWQKDLTRFLNEAGFIHDPLDFGLFSSLKLLWRASRERKLSWFLEEYAKSTDNDRGRKPSLIAHSFGTYLVARALQKYPEIKFDQVIFCGSIVRADFPWKIFFEAGNVTRVLNEIGKKDIWARFAEWVVPDAGNSGYNDFEQKVPNALLQRSHPEFRHSDFFYSLNYEKNWIPFLKGEVPKDLPLDYSNRVNWRFRMTVITVLVVLLVIAYFLAPALF